jgi:hypothetical protein
VTLIAAVVAERLTTHRPSVRTRDDLPTAAATLPVEVR